MALCPNSPEDTEPLLIGEEPEINENVQLPHSSSNAIHIPTYKARFWILGVFSLLACLQCLEWNTWGPISQSMDAAFSGWNSGTVAMMGNWGTITFVIFVVPMISLIHFRGLRAGTITSATLIAVGTSIRCLTLQTPAFTILCHIGAIFIGIPGTIIMSAPPVIASTWFPPKERTTATAFVIALNQLGSVLSYLQPLIVRSPGPNVSVEDIRLDVQKLMYYSAGASIFLLVCILVWFPALPPNPPSLTSVVERLEFRSAFRTLFGKKKFFCIFLSYSVFLGFPAAWMAVLNFSFLAFGIHQDEAMFIGILAVSCSCVSALIVGQFTDRFYGHLKKSLATLVILSFCAFLWFLFLTLGFIPPAKWQIYASVILGVSLNFASSPLYFELAVETSYPAPEAVVGGILTAGNNLVGITFLLLFFIPFKNYTWVTFCLVGGSIFSLFPLLLVREEYKRSAIDRGDGPSPTRSLSSSSSSSSTSIAQESPRSWFTSRAAKASTKLHDV